MKPTYFDLTVRDVGGAKRFFEAVLGWQFQKFGMPYEYFRIQAGPASEPGIDGGIGAIKDAPLSGGCPMTQLTIPVDDLEAVLTLVTAAGGAVVEPKMPIPGVGWYATCAEPGGLKFGLIQGDPGAGQPGADCGSACASGATRSSRCLWLNSDSGVMNPPVSELSTLLATMSPELNEGVYAYCVVPLGTDVASLRPVVTVCEPEGLTVVLPEQQALDAQLKVLFRAAWITLTVHSDLQAVGLTAAVAAALGAAGISCNVVAGAYHDHLFVPAARAQDALAALQQLQRDSAGA